MAKRKVQLTFSHTVFFALSVFLIVPSIVHGQIEPDSLDFGNVSYEDLEMTRYDQDTSAHALVLLDIGGIEYDRAKGMIYMEYHGRIKLFNSDAFYLADLVLPYSVEDGLTIEAVTHRLVDGQHKKTYVSPRKIATEEYAQGMYTKKVTFPSVTEGAILEYKYKVYGNSPFEFLPWYFQSTLPVKYSEFKLDIPGAFNLVPRLYGYNDLDYYDNGNEESAWHTLRMRNIPGLIEEPFVNKIDDHYSKVTFEYNSLFASDWDDLNKIILEVKGFGETIDKHKKISRFYPQDSAWQADKESLKSIHTYVSNHFDWNGEYGLIFNSKPRELWKSKTGSSADINLMLLMFLKKTGFEASPVFLSTISNGLVNPEFVTYGQFNNIVVYVKIEEEEYLLDATSKFRPYNLLPDSNINGEGLLIKKGEPRWISLAINGEIASEMVTSQIEVNSDQASIFGTTTAIFSSSSASNLKILLNAQNGEKVDEIIKEVFTELEPTDLSIDGLSDASPLLSISFNFEAQDAVEIFGDKMFFSPIIFKEVEENPFKLKERTLPIEFSMPMNKKYIINVKRPDGFEFTELPQPILYKLPDDAGSYSYQLMEKDDGLMILIRFNINKLFFLPEEYGPLREFFGLIISKQEERVVLSKKND